MDDLGTSDEDAGARSEDTAAASEPIRWGRAVAGLFVVVLGMLLLSAAIPLFIWALTVDEVCFWESKPVPAGTKVFVGFVGGFLAIGGVALLAGYRLLDRKPPPPD